jgi:putative flippase GtrA
MLLDLFWKLLKFGIVGFSGIFVDFGITYILKEKVKTNKYLANAIGFSIAATSNYILNRLWTFNSQNPQIIVEYWHFLMVSMVGLGINSFILWLMITKYGRNFYLSKLIAIGITIIWNFGANVLFTFA